MCSNSLKYIVHEMCFDHLNAPTIVHEKTLPRRNIGTTCSLNKGNEYTADSGINQGFSDTRQQPCRSANN